ncbi:hypothetical protein Tco_0287503 [Tanacetum coccineum]
MHNNIMAAGSKDRPPMLGPGRYSQWHSRFLRYLDTKSNGEYLRKCIFEGPYMPTNVLIAAVEAAENILPVAAHEELFFLIFDCIGDEVYSTVDACNTAKEMWTAIERLQQGESLNVQDVKTNLFWEFGKFTSRDGESMESYYSRMVKICDGCQAETGNRHGLISQAVGHTEAVSKRFSEEDSDPEQARRDKDMQKNLALLAKYFKKLYKPTNNNLRTSSNSTNKTEDTTPRYNNDNQSRQFGNQRTVTVAGARETVGSPR